MTIRPELPADLSAIHRLVEAAFGRRAEADLVDRLREACDDAVSLVADDRGTIVGHVLFSPVVIELPQRRVAGMGLAPLAVAPDRQRHGIGSNLVRRGLAILIERGCPFVVVLGAPGYYRRFGFDTASRRGLASQWDGIPDHTFMALILDDDAMAAVSGIARYRREFEELA